MTINISLTPESEAKLRQRAAHSGKDLAALASDILEEAIRRPSVEELLAPARREVAESGMTDQELDGFFEGIVKEVRTENNTKIN